MRATLQPFVEQGQVSRVEEDGLFEFSADMPRDRWNPETGEIVTTASSQLKERLGQIIDFGVRCERSDAQRP